MEVIQKTVAVELLLRIDQFGAILDADTRIGCGSDSPVVGPLIAIASDFE